jgi:DNA-binding NtrC family response regulator
MAIDFAMNLFPAASYGVRRKEAIPPDQCNPPDQSMGRKVMVVDDDDDFRFLLCDRLKRMGMKCFEAENGEVAKLQLKKNHVDLVITDNHMPIMDGLALIDWLQHTQRHMPVIFVSGDLSGPVKVKAEEARVYAIFEKPCSLSEISSKVEEVFKEI